jgi:uncharacterized membrane protein
MTSEDATSKLRNIIRAITGFFLVYLIFPKNAHAYIDPGTGSYILQLVLAFLLGALFRAKGLVNKIKSFFKRVLSKGNRLRKRVGD